MALDIAHLEKQILNECDIVKPILVNCHEMGYSFRSVSCNFPLWTLWMVILPFSPGFEEHHPTDTATCDHCHVYQTGIGTLEETSPNQHAIWHQESSASYLDALAYLEAGRGSAVCETFGGSQHMPLWHFHHSVLLSFFPGMSFGHSAVAETQ